MNHINNNTQLKINNYEKKYYQKPDMKTVKLAHKLQLLSESDATGEANSRSFIMDDNE